MSSQEGTITSFGLLIAYILPGFTALQGLPFLEPSKGAWGGAGVGQDVTVPGFVSGTVEALAAGLTVSTVRWILLDTLHHRTGLKPPAWDFALLGKGTSAFQLLIDIHYRYYKFYANMVVALLVAYATRGYGRGAKGLVYWVLAALFLLASRDALKKYYERAGMLLSSRAERENPY